MAAKEYSYTVFFEPAPEGGYIVTVPALPGLVTEGDTLDEAREMARDAIRAYLESLIKDGESIPEEEGTMQEKVAVAVDASF
ncbi:MAG: type II toxin-antitoxin system HicB family antitoxin [Thermodesulfobacteriota bacterium]